MQRTEAGEEGTDVRILGGKRRNGRWQIKGREERKEEDR